MRARLLRHIAEPLCDFGVLCVAIGCAPEVLGLLVKNAEVAEGPRPPTDVESLNQPLEPDSHGAEGQAGERLMRAHIRTA